MWTIAFRFNQSQGSGSSTTAIHTPWRIHVPTLSLGGQGISCIRSCSDTSAIVDCQHTRPQVTRQMIAHTIHMPVNHCDVPHVTCMRGFPGLHKLHCFLDRQINRFCPRDMFACGFHNHDGHRRRVWEI